MSDTPFHEQQQVEFFIGGRSMMASLAHAIEAAKKSIYIAGWRLNPFQKLRPDHPDSKIKEQTLKSLLHMKAQANVAVRVLIWDSSGLGINTGDEQVVHWLRKMPNVEVVADEVGYTVANSHHQKFVVIDDKVAFLGGIDIAGGRWDASPYPLFPGAGDPRISDFKSVFVDESGDIGEAGKNHRALGIYDFSSLVKKKHYSIPAKYGERAPRLAWHDVHVRVRGEVAKDISEVFCKRWNRLNEWWVAGGRTRSTLEVNGESAAVPNASARARMVLSIDRRSMPSETEVVRSYQDAYVKLIEEARESIYIENQYFISQGSAGHDHKVVGSLIKRVRDAMDGNENFRVVVVLPVHPDGDPNDWATREHYYWQEETIDEFRLQLGPDVDKFVGFFSPGRWERYKNSSYRVAQIYVHSKLLIADGTKALIGSANINARSLTGSLDTEIGLVIEDKELVEKFRKDLVATHLGHPSSEKDLLKAFNEGAEAEYGARKIWRHPIPDSQVWGLNVTPFKDESFLLKDALFFLRPSDEDEEASIDREDDRHGRSQTAVSARPIEELQLVEDASFTRRRFTVEQVEKTLGLAQAVPSLYPYRAAFLALERRFTYAFENCESWPALRQVKKHFYQVTDLISQRHVNVFDREICAADQLCRNLYEHHGSSANTVLTNFGRGGADYYKIRPQKDNELPVLVCLPTGAVNCVWKWTALGHEMGHQILHADSKLDKRLTDSLEKVSKRLKTRQLRDYVVRWRQELFSDLLGLVQFGPASALNLYSIARFDGRVDITEDNHPPLILRARLAEKILRRWSFSRSSLVRLPAFTELKIKGKEVSHSALNKDVERIAAVMGSLKGVEPWQEVDEESVASLKERLQEGYKPASRRRPTPLLGSDDKCEERHLVAASRILLHDVARQSRYPSYGLLDYVHQRVVDALARRY